MEAASLIGQEACEESRRVTIMERHSFLCYGNVAFAVMWVTFPRFFDPPGRSAPTVTLQVVVQKQAVVHGHEAEAGVVALLGDVPGGQTGVGQVSGSAADAPGPLQGLDVPRQTCTFT